MSVYCYLNQIVYKSSSFTFVQSFNLDYKKTMDSLKCHSGNLTVFPIKDSIIDQTIMSISLIDNVKYLHQSQLSNIKEEKVISENNASSQFQITLIVSISIFILTFIISELFRKWNKQNELKLYKSVIVKLWNKNEPVIDQYIESLNKFIVAIMANDDLNIALWSCPIISVSKLKSIGVEKIVDTLVVNLAEKDESKSTEMIMELMFELDNIDKMYEECRFIFNEFLRESRSLMDEWNLTNIQLTDILDGLSYNRDLNPIEEVCYRFVDKLVMDFNRRHANQFVGVSVWDDQIVTPALSFILSNSHEAGYLHIQSLIITMKKFKLIKDKHIALKGFAEVFDSLADNMKISKMKISLAIDYISQHDIKRFWCIK